MNTTTPESAPRTDRAPSSSSPVLRITLLYALITTIIVFISDLLSSRYLDAGASRELWEVIEDLSFILITTALVYLLARRSFRAIDRLDQHYRELVEGASDIVYTLDLDGRFTSINPAVEKVLGYTPTEVIGQRLVDLAPNLADRYETRLSGDANVRYELGLCARDGRAIQLEINSQRVINEGKPIGLHGVARDITARKQIEAALQSSEAQLRALFTAMTDTILVLDDTGRYLQVAPTSPRQLYRSQEELLGHTLHEVLEPAQADEFLAAIRRTLTTHQTVTLEYTLSIGGQPVWFAASLSPLNDRAVVWVARDITQRKQAEFALAHERDLLRALLDNTVDTVYFKDTQSRFMLINLAQARVLGVPEPQAALGKTDLDFFPSELANFMWAEERQIIETGQPVLSREEFNPTHDGQPRWFSVSKNPIFDEAGQIVGLVGVSRDITAVKLREREFAAMSLQNAQLLAAEREQRVFTEALRDTAAALNSTLNVDEVLDRVLANIERVVPHDIANIMLINLEDGQPVARVARCHGYDRISLELDRAVRQLSFPVAAVSNLRQMMETGQPFIISDTHTYPGWVDSPSTRWQRSYVGAPVHLRDSVIGFIQLDSREVNFFTPVAAERLQTFADQTAVAIENAKLFQAEREQHALAEALRDAASVLSGTLDFDEVLDLILSTVGRIVPNDVATLLLIEHGVARVIRAVGYQDPAREEKIRQLRFVVEQTPNLRRVVETQRPCVVTDTATDPFWTPVPGIDWIKSNIVAPMIVKGRIIGMLALDSSLSNFYAAIHAERLQVFASQGAVALENAQLFNETQQRLKELAVLFDGSRAMTASLDRSTVLNTISRCLAEAVDATSVYVLSVDLERGVVQVMSEYFGPAANDLERVSDLGATYNLDDLPDTLEALRHGQPSITTINDPRAETIAMDLLRIYGGKSLLRVPMNVADQVRAYAVIWDSRRLRQWTDAEIQLCQTLANQAAVALENVLLLEETRRGLKEQSALLAASTAVSSSLNLNTVLKSLAEQMGRAIDATSVYVCEWNRAANTSTVVVEYYGPTASNLERVSDLGVTYDLVEDYGPEPIWQQPGGHQISQVNDPDLLPARAAHLRQYGCSSVLTVGLTAKANVFGYIELWETRRSRVFTSDEIMLCQAIAQQAAIAFENARLFEAERKQLRLAQTLQAVGALLTAQMSLDEVFDYLFDLLARVVAYDSVSVQLVEDDRLVLAAGRGFPDTTMMRNVIRHVSRVTLEERWGAAHQRVMTLSDTHADPRWILYPGSEYIRSWIGAALRVKGRLLGILNVDSNAPGAYTEELGETVAAFANQAAIAIENAQLNDAVRRHADELEDRVVARTIELEHERKRTAAILDTAGEGIIFTDASGTIEYINRAMERLTGYTPGETLGQNPRLWKSGLTSPALYHELWDTIKRGRIWQGELVNRRKDGRLYDAALTIAPLYNTDGQLAGFVSVQRDVTQRKELDRLKDEFVSNVSHELRTPIANVKLYISLLTRGKPERHDEYLQTLRRESARLETLIENLLDLSRLDLDTVKVDLQPVDLNPLTAQLIEDRTALAASRQHTIDYHADDRMVLALADPAALGQVFTNLLTNAINYTPPNGMITVSVAYRADAGQTWATITVKDSGPGISATDLPHLFQRFYRGEAGRKSGAPGTGLGLAISDKIIARLGGQLTVDSQPGHGAAFTVWLKTAA